MKTIEIWIDGGSKRNGSKDAEAYGSALIVGNSANIYRFQFSRGLTNNEAEYGALLMVLDLLGHQAGGWEANVDIYSDSQLLVEQFNERWKCKKAHLRRLRDAALDGRDWLSKQGISIFVSKVSRDEIVEKLGH